MFYRFLGRLFFYFGVVPFLTPILRDAVKAFIVGYLEVVTTPEELKKQIDELRREYEANHPIAS